MNAGRRTTSTWWASLTQILGTSQNDYTPMWNRWRMTPALSAHYVTNRATSRALPELSPSPYPDMNHITIHTNGVANMLRHIKAHKIPACLLKEAADQLAPMLTTIFQASYTTKAPSPLPGSKQMLFPSSKRGTQRHLQTTALYPARPSAANWWNTLCSPT